jgi:hypothetical protein
MTSTRILRATPDGRTIRVDLAGLEACGLRAWPAGGKERSDGPSADRPVTDPG